MMCDIRLTTTRVVRWPLFGGPDGPSRTQPRFTAQKMAAASSAAAARIGSTMARMMPASRASVMAPLEKGRTWPLGGEGGSWYVRWRFRPAHRVSANCEQ